MAMKTLIQVEGELIKVSLSGHLDYETTEPLRSQLNTILEQATSHQVIFDMTELHFVGSSGITSFLHTLRDFNDRASRKPRYLNVRTEFRRLITSLDGGHTFDFWDTSGPAVNSRRRSRANN